MIDEDPLSARPEGERMSRDWKAECFKYAPSSRADLVENLCTACGGSGYQVYDSTATWRGGVGGQTMTQDVCCKCWGSGDAERPWPSWRRYEAQILEAAE